MPAGDRALAFGVTISWARQDATLPPDLPPSDTAKLWSSLIASGAFVDANGVATAIPVLSRRRGAFLPYMVAAEGRHRTLAWEADDTLMSRPEATAVRAATFDGADWRDSQTLIATPGALLGLRLGRPPVARIAADSARGIVAVVERDSNRLVLFRRRADGWQRTSWHSGGWLIYASASVSPDGGIVVLAMGQGLVFGLRADWSDSVQWSNPIVIDTLRGTSEAFSWARLGGDSLVAVWRQSFTAEALSRIVTALTVDGGRHWQLTPPFALKSDVESPQLAVDDAGRVHVVFRATAYENIINQHGQIFHAMWQAGAWTGSGPVARRTSDGGPAFGNAPNGKLLVIGGDIVKWLPRSVWAKSWASLWSPGPGC